MILWSQNFVIRRFSVHTFVESVVGCLSNGPGVLGFFPGSLVSVFFNLAPCIKKCTFS